MNTIDICQTVFVAADKAGMMPETTDNFVETLDQLRDTLSYAQRELLNETVMIAVCKAQEDAFKLGWQLRGQL